MRVAWMMAAAAACVVAAPASAAVYTFAGDGVITARSRNAGSIGAPAKGAKITGGGSVDTGTDVIPDRFTGWLYLDQDALLSGAQSFSFDVGFFGASSSDRSGGLIAQGAGLLFDRGRLIDVGLYSWIEPDTAYVGNGTFGFFRDYNGAYASGVFHLSGSFTPVPEPLTWALMILGFGAVGGALRRQRRLNDAYGV